ncbi:tetrapyrrole-binding protein, chloroplastic [Rhodamnia argentea]|uniref:Tetrapyrrole-binding protein, chloroplastic n=1 Tax=Rhodamnia argentea TaxID=178133 RepID=A0ABM3HUS6_9MYRT|nr:tetrapyrrole-binding protein, chloroplastic [Rhodamnia argentea]XP_048140350.1 tetrapyrrole-binding protein, chloroplastic [Rhodamnia argentea]XP_048140352.1 tetrapyrrole-binding protein, chloroplastic [Rhodamnia argentea]
MATNSLNPLRHQHRHHHRLRRRNSLDSPSSSLFLKPTTTTAQSLSSHSLSINTTTTTTFSLSPTTDAATSTTPPPSSTSLDLLERHLAARDFRQADEETRRLLIALAGDAALKRGYVFFSEVQFIAAPDLKTIDDLWRRHSDGRFGYSVQKRLWDKAKRDFTRFFIKVGWMKKLDTEVEQYNYRSFPTEFVWELKEDTPEGHLPLTNALRGTQLLNNILTHPAFADMEEGGEEAAAAAEAQEQQADSPIKNGGLLKGLKDKNASSKPQPKTVFKPDYSF